MNQQHIYFEKQPFFSLQCGLYTINHLLGSKIYTQNHMKDICYQLSDSLINPHKHPFGGDYDVNVLMVALAKQGLNTQWFDRRKLPFDLNKQQKERQLVGLLINVYSDTPLLLHKIFRVSRRHWLSVRRRGDIFYWLDSKCQTYTQYKVQELQEQVNRLLKAGEQNDDRSELLLVYRDNKQTI